MAGTTREFCVQYGETDYDFLCRMAAEEGIFFYEEHAYKSTDQSLVLCDTVRHLPESFEIPWIQNPRTEVSTLCISQFLYSAQIRPSSVVTKDYTFKRPGWAGRFDQEGQHQDYQRTQYELYDYPGRFKGAHGQNFARWQMDGWRNNAETARGMSRSPEIWPGRRIVLTDAETARGMSRSPEIWPGRRIVLTGHPQANLNRVVSKVYTFKRPGWAWRFDEEGQHQDYQRTHYEVYDSPGRFKGAHGQNFARWQMDGWRNNAETARGMGRSPEIWPGRRIVLTGHPQANLNREWQVVASELHGEQPQAVPGRQGAGRCQDGRERGRRWRTILR